MIIQAFERASVLVRGRLRRPAGRRRVRGGARLSPVIW